MAYVGEPFLAAVSNDAILRLYRLTAGVFSQIASRAYLLPFGIPGADAPRFASDGDQRLFWAEPNVNDSVTGTSFKVMNADYSTGGLGAANNPATRAVTYPSFPHTALTKNLLLGGVSYTCLIATNQMLTDPGNVSGTGNTYYHLYKQGQVAPYRDIFSNTFHMGVEEGGMAISNDGSVVAAMYYDGTFNLFGFDWYKAAAGADPMIGQVVAASGKVFRAAFSSDDRYVIYARKNGQVGVQQFTHATEPHYPSTPAAPALVGSPETRTMDHGVTSLAVWGNYVAVGNGYDTGGGVMAYSTDIFTRLGTTLIPVTTIAGIGKDLIWSADGTLLIDAPAKKAYKRVAKVFTEQVGMMANVSGTVISASLSPHMPVPVPTSQFYDTAVGDFSDGTIDESGLSILLLSSNTFIAAQTTVAAVIASAGEAYGNGWPQGGKALGAATETKDAIGRVVKAAKVSQGIIGGTLTARAALIYIGTRPLIFIDFQTDRTIDDGATMEIDVNTNGFLAAQAAL